MQIVVDRCFDCDYSTYMATTYYYILCECGSHSEALMSNGQVMTFTTKRAANQEVAHMRLLMEGGPKTTYTVKAAK